MLIKVENCVLPPPNLLPQQFIYIFAVRYLRKNPAAGTGRRNKLPTPHGGPDTILSFTINTDTTDLDNRNDLSS